MVIEALNGIAGAMTFPAMQGLMPQVVPAGELQQANALMGMVRNGAMVVGPALGSAVVVAAGSGWAIAADAASFLLAAAAFSRLRLPALLRLAGDSVLRDLRTGWGEFTGRTWLWVIVVCAGFQNAIYGGAWVTLGPVVADRTFGRGPWGVILGAQAAGLLIGTITLLRLRFRFPLRAGMLGVAAIAPLIFTLGAAPREWLLVGLAVVSGFGLEVFGIAWETALQQHVPVEVLSRVFAYDALGSLVAVPVGQLTFAPLARAFGINEVIVAGAIAYLALAVATLAVPSVWRMRGAQDGASPG
jgi:MFS family permease